MANTTKKSNKIWVDGNTLVKIDGEKMVDFELNGNGYSAKLKAFIAKRDKALEEARKKIELCLNKIFNNINLDLKYWIKNKTLNN